MNKTASDLPSRLLALIRRGVDRPTTDAEFNALALEVFAFQFAQGPVYQTYCASQQRTPATVTHWTEIPAVPARAFKDFVITCFPAAEAVAEFHTSGTTHGTPGRHLFKTLELYEAALTTSFAAHLLPDNARLPVVILTPAPADAPHSSLVHMCAVVAREFGARSVFCAPAQAVAEMERIEEPVLLLGTAFAFVHLFDECEAQGRRLRLTRGSRVMETGGFKGRTRTVAKPAFYAMFERYLSVPARRVVNEYGMTELSTQFYDDTLRCGGRTDLKIAPPWARVTIVDPYTGKVDANQRESGLIRVLDLANLWSAMCVQTEDLGVNVGNGFEIRGRATGAELRGCSLTAEALWSR